MKKLSHGLLLASMLMMSGDVPALRIRPEPKKKLCRRKSCEELTSHKKGFCSPECKKGI